MCVQEHLKIFLRMYNIHWKLLCSIDGGDYDEDEYDDDDERSPSTN